MGLIYWWARLGVACAAARQLAHADAAACAALAKSLGGIAHAAAACRRSRPRRSRPGSAAASRANAGRPRVLLWPDTFNNHFHPRRRSRPSRCWRPPGFEVAIPPRPLCCGRPLYDFGMLDTAKRLLRADPRRAAPGDRGGHAGRRPRAELRRGLPRRAAEPVPDGRGRQAAVEQTLHPQRVPGRPRGGSHFRLPPLRRKALVQSTATTTRSSRLDARAPSAREARRSTSRSCDSGCCGMAGSFGFEAGALRRLGRGRRARAAAARCARPTPSTLIIADGFSCREQIEQATGRRTLHLAEVIASSLGFNAAAEVARPQREPVAALATLVAGIGLGMAVAAMGHRRRQARQRARRRPAAQPAW